MKKASVLLIAIVLFIGCKEKKEEYHGWPQADYPTPLPPMFYDSAFEAMLDRQLLSSPHKPDTIYIHDTIYYEWNKLKAPDHIIEPENKSWSEITPLTPPGFYEIPIDSSFDWPHILDSLYESKNKIIDTTPNL